MSTSEGLVQEQWCGHGRVSPGPAPSRVCANLSVRPGKCSRGTLRGNEATKPGDPSHGATTESKHREVSAAGAPKRHAPGVNVTRFGRKGEGPQDESVLGSVVLHPMGSPSREGDRPVEDGAEVEGCLESDAPAQPGRTPPRSLRGKCGSGPLDSSGLQPRETAAFSSQATRRVLVCTAAPGGNTDGFAPSRQSSGGPHGASLTLLPCSPPHGPRDKCQRVSLAKVSGQKGWGWLLTSVALLEWGAVGREPLKGKNPLPFLFACRGFLGLIWGRRFAFLILSV